jgi:hypothetical protein
MLSATSYRFVYNSLLLMVVATLLNSCKPVSQEAVGVVEGKNADGKQIGLPCQIVPAKTVNAGTGKYLIDFVVDGSASMAGFVKNGSGRYNKVIELLDNFTLVNPGQVEYFRMDESVKKIERSNFQQAKTAPFYTGKTNKIADALEASLPKTDKLVLIVTDLQQDDGDTKQATKKLVDNYLKVPGYGVAVWGFKSEFDGLVYPPSPARPYPYQAASLAKGHPFYVLMVGRLEHINDFAKQLRAQSGSLLDDSYNQLSIFSPDSLVEEVAYLKGDPKAMPEGFSAPSSLLLNGVAFKDGGQPIGLLEINNRAVGKSKLEYVLSNKGTKSMVSSWVTQTTTTIKKYDDGQNNFMTDSTTKGADFQANHAMKDQNIDVSLKINPDGLKSGLYYITTDVQVVALKTPGQWDSWHDGGQNNGAKTAGLKEFLDSLAVGVSTLTKEKPVTIARLCHGIQKN